MDTGASVNVLDELNTISFLPYILRSCYDNELRTMASMRGVVPFCLARPHLGSGRELSSWCPLLPIFAIRSSSFFSYFFFFKIDISFGAFATVLFCCYGCPQWEVWPCEAPWQLRSIERGGFCSDLPRCAFLLNLKIRFPFTVPFYINCYVLLHLQRDFTLFFSANFHNVFMLG